MCCYELLCFALCFDNCIVFVYSDSTEEDGTGRSRHFVYICVSIFDSTAGYSKFSYDLKVWILVMLSLF